MFDIFGPSKKHVKYVSAAAANTTLDHFMGEDPPECIWDEPKKLPIDDHSNLEDKFCSGVNRTDCPRMWGYSQPFSGRKLISGGGQRTQTFELTDALKGWKRLGGEPLYRKEK